MTAPRAIPAPPPQHPAAGLRIAVLGPCAVTGAAVELQPKQAELVVALALAGPAGRTGESPRQMPGTGPGHPRPPGSLRQLITRTRRLGTAPASGPYAACRGNSTYALDPSAAVDWDEFRILAGRGRAGRDCGRLCDALTLVRGKPPLAGLL